MVQSDFQWYRIYGLNNKTTEYSLGKTLFTPFFIYFGTPKYS